MGVDINAQSVAAQGRLLFGKFPECIIDGYLVWEAVLVAFGNSVTLGDHLACLAVKDRVNRITRQFIAVTRADKYCTLNKSGYDQRGFMIVA